MKNLDTDYLESNEVQIREISPSISADTFYQEQIDSKLWSLFKSGDEGAFIAIYQKYVDTLYNYGIQYSKDDDFIKDCLQDFFIYLREKRSKLSDVSNIKYYLIKGFRRKLIDSLKKSKKFTDIKSSYCDESLFKFEISHETKLIEQQFSTRQTEALNKAISKLSSKEKEAVYLYFYDNFSYKEISTIQGYTHISSVRRLIYKALDQLRISLKLVVLFIFYSITT
jgi:RNA polymerase sigma-70 factor (ECF subfamily)